MAEYCNVGGFTCKYCYESKCDFFDMGSGNAEDMPCLVTRIDIGDPDEDA